MPNIIYTTISSIFIFLLSKKICYNPKYTIKDEKNTNIQDKKQSNDKHKYITKKNQIGKAYGK